MTFDPGPLAAVSAEAADGQWRLVFTREFRHSCERVWDALTRPEQLSKWAPFTASRPLDQPGAVTLTMIDADNAVDLDGSVTRVEPPHVLEYSWGSDVLRWELTAAGSGCRLVLEHTTDDRDMIPKAAAGWHLCLFVAEAVLNGDDIAPIRGGDARNYGWDDLAEKYGAALGIPFTGFPEGE
jgi:uncharacterized protein YndB with AHSA1/START domain